jgi:hypothetical protein
MKPEPTPADLHRIPDATDADAMMITARRTRTDPCFPRRTICCSR